MQNWNQWQLSAGAVTTPVPQPPVGYAAAAGADPITLMQSYMQYYNQPAPSGYSPEQWAAAQQQGWAQWQQWQQQYQQWQAQYGDKYQETMKHLSAQNMNLTGQMQLPSNVQPPPLPKEDVRPPLPSATTNTYQFANMPPPHQNNLPLFPTKEPANKTISQVNVTNYPTNPPLPTSQPPLPSEIGENRESISFEKCASNVISESNSAKKLNLEVEELTESEKIFDEQFQQWEEQFNKWKQQNVNHPDKTQYQQYEAKWTSWREKLIERREQMRKKREQQKQVAVKAEAEKNKNISGDDKILNILSNTENQRLINNLLGIGQTLGLTGKQNTTAPLPPPPPPPPPLPETTNSNNQPTTQGTQSTPSQANMIKSNIAPAWSNSQQWRNQQQYNPRTEVPGYSPGTPTMPTMPLMSSTPDVGLSPMISPNFAQPPPNLPNNLMPNFSQPPPNFSSNDRPQLQNVRPPGPVNTKDCPPFSSADPSNMDMRFIHPNDRLSHSFDGQPNFRRGDQERFGSEVNINPNLNEQDQFKTTDTFDKIEAQRFRRGDRNYSDFGNNQLNSQDNFNLNNEQFGPTNDRLGTGNDRFNRENNRFGPMGNDRFLSGGDRFGSNNDRLAPGSDRFGNEWLGPEGDRFRAGIDRFGMDKDRRGLANDRFGPDNERFPPDRFASSAERFTPGLGTDRFSSGNDRFGLNSEYFRSNDRFSKGNTDYFDSKDVTDHRRDNFGTNPRGFNRNPSFSPPNELSPELKKLMEKRKAAGDVFRPSFIDSDKSSSVGSLSESFKKIAGDSPFRSSFDLQKNLPNRSGPISNFSSSGPSNFQLHSDLGQISTPYAPRHPFRSDNEPPFRGPLDNFAKHPKDYNERGNDMELRIHPNQSQPINIQSQVPVKHPGDIETTDSNPLIQTDNIADSKNAEAIQVNETDNTNEQKNLIISEDNSKKVDTEESKLLSTDTLLQQEDKEHDNNQTQSNAEKIEESRNNNDSDIKKPESLPFMGENDPRPEDLNIEPPPELPNLCLISTNSNQNAPLNSIEDFDKKGPAGNKFDTRFDRNFGFRGMELKSGAPFEPRGSPMSAPRGLHTFPTGSSTFQPQGSINTQLDLRGSNDGHVGPNASNESRVNSGISNDEQFSERGRNDQSEALNSGQFGSRDVMDRQFDQFGSKTLGNGKFGRPTDLQFRPRGPIDSSFPPRNPFGPRGNEMQFRPRGINDRLDSRTIFEGPFGPRGLNDGSFERMSGPNDSFLNTRHLIDPQHGPMGPNRFGRMNEVSFDKRPPFDNSGVFGFPGERSLGPRMSNEGPLGLRGSNDISLGSRDSNDALLQRNSNFNENQLESRDSNNGSFEPSNFKARGSLSDTNNASFPSRSDSFHNRSDYMRRNSYNPRREQFEDNISAKKARYESPKPADEFTRSCPENENIDIEMRKDKTTEYAGNTSNLHKKELEIVPRPRYGPNDTWKDKFGNDLRPDITQQNIDSNVPNMFDEKLKSEKITTEPKTVGDYRPQHNESAASPADFQKKHSSNLFMKRSQLRTSQDFCVQRQFNYNHGEIDKKFVEPLNFTPMKVIDYGHASRLSITDQHLSPVQCFDYGHGNQKSVVLDREQHQQQHHHHHYAKKDVKNWMENEENLKEYTEKGYVEKTRKYENYDARRSTDYNKRKEHDWQSSDKMYEAERKENDDCKEKGYNPKSEIFERNSSNDQNDLYQSDRSINKERVQEIRENSRKETNKDNDKDDNRSKGSVNWQESTNKNVVDTKLQETSLPLETKKNVVESTTKTLELAKMPNYTMVDDLLCPPGRQNRPLKIAIILRGPPGSGKSFVAKLIKDKEVEQGGSAPRILSLDDYFLVEKEIETKDDNGKKVTVKEMVYEYEEAMEQSYVTSLVKAFKKNITDGFFSFIILDCINEKISDYEEMWSFAKTKGFKVYVCEMEMDLQICLKRNIHNRTEDEINRIIDYFEPTPSYHQKLDVNSMLQDQAIEEVDMEDSEETQEKSIIQNEDSQDSHEDTQEIGVSKWEKMEVEDKLDRLDGLARKKNETKPQTMEDFLQVPDYYNMEDTSGKKRVRWADLEERKEQEKMRAVGFVVGHTNWDRMMDPTKGGSALTRTKYI
ncbi:uncharacterized protein LOC126856880 isoform X1 [Cataglyphis hispanica]|uniref:uncharacterized protein LOC126856880 isoform X1 n=1 Tax=Cataglyphis hispanica TaxID=1086592 RepID=UPI00217F667E|nr:uncharacterized protein LOC126856880 isoform X1 [Cataglyphis hispanica]